MQGFRVVAALALASLLAAPALARATEHPRVFYRAADVPTLRAKAGSTHAAIAGSLKAGADEFLSSRPSPGGDVTWSSGRTFNLGDLRDVGTALVVWSFNWQLQGTPESLDQAKGWLLTVAGWGSWDLDGQRDLTLGHLVYGAAFAYDVLYPQLTDAERATVRDAIAREADALMRAGKGGVWWESDTLQNHNWINHAAVGFAGLVLQGEVAPESTEAWIGYAAANARHVKVVCDSIADGTWHEGVGYLAYGLIWHLPFVEALRAAGREDLTDLKLLRGLGTALLHMQLPEKPNTYALPYGDFSGFDLDNQLWPLRYAATRYGSGAAQLTADRWTAGTPRTTYGPESAQQVFEFLFFDPSAPRADLAAEPLDWYGRDLQAVVFRSGWEAGSLVFAMKSAPFGGRSAVARMQAGAPEFAGINFAHDHADDNGFYLYGNGAWLAPEATGYFIGHPESPGPQANRTIFHNSLLVDGAGQLGEAVRASGDDSRSYPWFLERQGGIPFQASTAHQAYAVADGARLYPKSAGLTRFDRHALFLDRRFVVLRDVVSATAPHAYGWVVHATDGATREGSWLRNASKDGQVLGVAVVSPASFGVATEAQAPAKLDKFDPDGSVTAVTVTPSAPSTDATFLTALVPTTSAAWASRPEVRALDAAQPAAGLEIVEPGRVSRAIFASPPAPTAAAGGLALDGAAAAVAVQDGAPVRATLVRGRSIADGARTLLAVATPTDALEADGLGGEAVLLSGKLDGVATVWAPRATRAFLNGVEVSFARDGESIRLPTAPAAQPVAADPATAPSAPALGGGASTNPTPAPPVVPAIAVEPGTLGGATPAAPDAPAIGPAPGGAATVATRGGCSGGGEASALGLLAAVGVVARAVRRLARRTPPPAPEAAPEEEAAPDRAA